MQMIITQLVLFVERERETRIPQRQYKKPIIIDSLFMEG